MNTLFRLPDAKLSDAVASTLQTWDEKDICGRIWDKDHTVWSPDPTELSNRLGWLFLPETSLEHVEDIQAFAAEISDAEMQTILD